MEEASNDPVLEQTRNDSSSSHLGIHKKLHVGRAQGTPNYAKKHIDVLLTLVNNCLSHGWIDWEIIADNYNAATFESRDAKSLKKKFYSLARVDKDTKPIENADQINTAKNIYLLQQRLCRRTPNLSDHYTTTDFVNDEQQKDYINLSEDGSGMRLSPDAENMNVMNGSHALLHGVQFNDENDNGSGASANLKRKTLDLSVQHPFPTLKRQVIPESINLLTSSLYSLDGNMKSRILTIQQTVTQLQEQYQMVVQNQEVMLRNQHQILEQLSRIGNAIHIPTPNSATAEFAVHDI